MKKSVVLFGIILFVFSACSKNQNANIQQKVQIPTVQDLTQNQGIVSVIPTEEQYVEMAVIPSPEELLALSNGVECKTVDVDMTNLSSTMLYSEVFNMVIMPEEYENKVLKIKGNFAVYVNKESGEKYFSVIIPDATACCQQGIEFVWVGNHHYPEDFPKIGQEITVTGLYKIIDTENGLQYNYMQVTDLEF